MILLQVKHIFRKSKTIQLIVRNIHDGSKVPGSLYRLEKRALLGVRGVGEAAARGEAAAFLQGLLTNDVRHLREDSPCIYAMFLSTKGRVLYDTLLHTAGTPDAFFLECDSQVLPAIKKHLKMYRLKKQIDIDDLSKEHNLYALVGDQKELPIDLLKKVKIHRDPRIQSLGFRIIAPSDLNSDDLCKAFSGVSLSHSDGYKYLRYQLGVGEGVDDLPPGTCSPLEVNSDYLHGVSFHKGCYIGQELTARVHHTGVVRRRFMPIHFKDAPLGPITRDAGIFDVSNPKSNIGKLKGVMSDYGLALLRINEALQAKSLEVAGYTASVSRPSWWPIEAPKEKVNAAQSEA